MRSKCAVVECAVPVLYINVLLCIVSYCSIMTQHNAVPSTDVVRYSMMSGNRHVTWNLQCVTVKCIPYTGISTELQAALLVIKRSSGHMPCIFK